MVNYYKNKKISVLGMGLSGISCAILLDGLGSDVLISDTKDDDKLKEQIKKIPKSIRIETGGHSASVLDADLIVSSPGIDTNIPILQEAYKKNIPVLSEIEVAFSLVKPKLIIAVTGTNGKSTTTALIGEIFKQAGEEVIVGGNIGIPFSAFVNKINANTVVVLEISSFQLEKIKTFYPHIGLILNITPDHLERHKNMDIYAGIKADLFKKQAKENFAILNADDYYCSKIAEKIDNKLILFSRKKQLDKGVFVKEGKIFFKLDNTAVNFLPIELSEVKLPGPHNLENVLAACSVAIAAGVNVDKIVQTLKDFSGLEHRLEPVREVGGVKFINDSKATNISSTLVALESFSEKLILIMGGRDKGSSYAPLKELIKEKVKLLIVLGEAAEKINKELSGCTKIEKVAGVKQAVDLAYKNSLSGDVVLLSPGCSSYDQFMNFEERGRFFKTEVKRL